MMIQRKNGGRFRQIGGNGMSIIKQYEQGPDGGFAATPYVDDAGHPTIGWGHKILPGESFPYPITAAEAEQILDDDLDIAEMCVDDVVRVPINGNQFDALVSLTFNIGIGAFERSTLLHKLNAGDFQGAAAQFGRWRMAGGKILRGLVLRRKKEADLFLLSNR